MKNHLSWIALLLAGTFNHALIAQEDLQWFILNGLGKDGTDPTASPPANNFKISGVDTGVFNIKEYSYPRTSRGKNDFLVIYTDGTHYNSRTESTFFPSPPQLPSTVNSHNFRVPPGKRILHLYTTRRYEDDDPPEKVKLVDQPDANAIIHDIGQTTPDSILSANHAVVRNRDITLIIDLSKLRSSISVGTTLGSTTPGTYKLRFQKLTDNAGNEEKLTQASFAPSKIFNSSSGPGPLNHSFPASGLSAIQASNDFLINTSIGSPFLYINLRPTDALNNFYSDRNGNQAFKAHFEVLGANDIPVATLIEPLLEAFDPNFIRLNNLCEPISGKPKFVEYHIEFENTGTVAVSNGLSVTLSLPGQLGDICSEETNWTINGQPYKSRITRTNCQNLPCTRSDFKIIPVGDYTLEGCGTIDGISPPNNVNCKGTLTLRARIRGDYPISDIMPVSELMPTACKVSFGDNETPINIVTTTQILHPAFGPGPLVPRLIRTENCEGCDTLTGWLMKNIRLALLAAAIFLVSIVMVGKILRKPKPPIPDPLA